MNFFIKNSLFESNDGTAFRKRTHYKSEFQFLTNARHENEVMLNKNASLTCPVLNKGNL